MEAVNGCVKGLSNFVSASDTVGESGDLVNEHSSTMEAFRGSAFSQRLLKVVHYHGCFQIQCTIAEAFKYCTLPQMLSNTVHYRRCFQILCTTADAFKYCALLQRLSNTVHYHRDF